MIDLHLHLDGSLNPDNILHMADMSKISLPYEDKDELYRQLKVSPYCSNLSEYLEKFVLPLQVLQTGECIEYAVYELLRDVYSQGLCYVEIRFAPQLHTKAHLTQDEAVSAAVKGLKRGTTDFDIKAQLILCCMRNNSNHKENEETVRIALKYLGNGVCAIDLAGNEAAYPTGDFADIFRQAASEGIPFTIHAGEAAGAESVWKALELGAVRIGHGIRSSSDKALMDTLSEKGIYLEMCYSSNMQTHAVDKSQDYPLRLFIDRGVNVTINTDNMTVSGTTLKREYQILQKQFAFTENELKSLALNSAYAAFLPEADKRLLYDKVNSEFGRWFNAI